MNWLIEKRRRVYFAERRTRESQERLGWIAVAAMIAALLGGGLLAAPTLELHLLDSLVAALLSRA